MGADTPDDKIIGTNFNSIKNATVGCMKSLVLNHSRGFVTSQQLAKATKKDKQILRKFFKLMTAEDDATPIAAGQKLSAVLDQLDDRVVACGHRIASVVWLNDLPDWRLVRTLGFLA